MATKRSWVRWILVIGLVFGLTGLAPAGQVQNQLAAESTLIQVQKRGTLRVGMSTFIPWTGKNKAGKFVGFEIEVAERLAEDMGVEVEFVPTKWSGIIPSLLTGKFDVIICGMGMTPKRNLKVNFTIPYSYAGPVLLGHTKMCEGMTTLEDFNRPDVIFVERFGSSPVDLIKRMFPKAQLVLFDDEGVFLQELRNGRAHATILDMPKPAFEALAYPDLLSMPLGKEKLEELPISFALRKGDPDWLNFLNNWITFQHSKPWMQERYDYWFTTMDWKDQIN